MTNATAPEWRLPFTPDVPSAVADLQLELCRVLLSPVGLALIAALIPDPEAVTHRISTTMANIWPVLDPDE